MTLRFGRLCIERSSELRDGLYRQSTISVTLHLLVEKKLTQLDTHVPDVCSSSLFTLLLRYENFHLYAAAEKHVQDSLVGPDSFDDFGVTATELPCI